MSSQHLENDLDLVGQARSNMRENRILTAIFGIEIPEKYYYCPIISNLIAHFNLEVNILAAFLGKTTERRGWFELQLRGTELEIESALVYLSVIDILPKHLKVCRD
jgi:hypothetical protein